MARLLLIAAVVVAAFMIYALVDCTMTRRRQVRGLPKAVWCALIVVLPAIGGILWLIIGRGTIEALIPKQVPPDDNPAFLRRVQGSGWIAPRPAPSTPDDADEIRRFEEELAKLEGDADTDDR